jgi:hypothetical protein
MKRFATVVAVFLSLVGITCAQPVNYQGLWWNSPPMSESGWGLNLAHQGDTIFATWYTYDTAGDGWWLSMTASKIAEGTYAGALIETAGPPFSAVPFDPTKVIRTAVGSGTLTFSDENNGSFSYSVKGVTQMKSLVRMAFGPVPTCTYGLKPDFAAAKNYQDLWWVGNGVESGWGINLAHQGDIIFATWYTYDTDGSPMWLSVTAAKVASGTYTGDLIRTTGPAFNAVPFDPSKVTRTVVGRATFAFANGNAAGFNYTVNGVTQTKRLTRVLFAPPAGTVCGPPGELTFDKISLATFAGASETVKVTATDASANPVAWTAQSENPAVAKVLQTGSQITVTGVGLGRTQLTVRTSTGVERTLPVRVYDPRVLGVGIRDDATGEIPEEIQIKYVDQFTCRWTDAHAGANIHASFYHPAIPAADLANGWRALGSLGVGGALECPSVNGQQWMMVVRTNPEVTVPGRLPPLKLPLRYESEWNDAGTGGAVMFGAFWTPICDAGYVAMGTVVTGGSTSAGRNPPPLGDTTCVRNDLTKAAQATALIWKDEGTGGDVKFQGSFSMEAQNNAAINDSTAYLTTGTFVTRGQLRSCPSDPRNCWTLPGLGSHAVMNTLAVDLPMLIDTPKGSTIPRLTEYVAPPAETEPVMTKAMLVPFTAIGSGTEYSNRTRHWMVNNSPFVRTERVLRYKLLQHMYNNTSVAQEMRTTFEKGVTTERSTTMSHTAGISITGEGGVKFLGTGGSISATVSYQFGYQTQTSVAEFYSVQKTVTTTVPPYKAAAAWLASSNIVVKLHNLESSQLEWVTSLDMGDDLDSYQIDEYPD